MSEQLQYYLEKIDIQLLNSTDYRQKALLQATKVLLEEQVHRIEQKKGELDGRMWSPNNW